MDSAAREVLFMAREQDTEESSCTMVLLPPDMKKHVLSFISTQESLSCLGRSCRAWNEVVNEEIYKRDSRENHSFAIKWMAAHAVDEQRTDSALRTLEISRRWGGQIDAVKPRLSRSDEARSDDKDQIMYDTSTALHFAVFLGNVRLTKTLLDMKASLEICCLSLLWESMGSEELLLRVRYFQQALWRYHSELGPAFPILLAFLQGDSDMCKLLIENGAGREATLVSTCTGPKAVSILHFAAADLTTDYRKWQCLFHEFHEYIDEPWPRIDALTPLHVALKVGCTQGMELAVKYGADKEAKNDISRTPLSVGIIVIPNDENSDPGTLDERTMCFRKFVELGANLNPEGDSVLVLAVRRYASHPVRYPFVRHVIYFLLDHHADVHGTRDWQDTNLVYEIIQGILLVQSEDPPVRQLIKDLLIDLVDRGLNFTTLGPKLPSPLHSILQNCQNCDDKAQWLSDLLCEKGALIHEREVSLSFIRWCEIPQWWRNNENSAWWQHQGQEYEIFKKWREGPYNAWWCQHIKRISPIAVENAYKITFKYEDRQLYDILTHLPLAAPADDLLVSGALYSFQSWSWSVVVLHEFDDNFVATWSYHRGENMIHLTIRFFILVGGYSVADAIRDILHLRSKGAGMTSRNSNGQTPLEILLASGSSKNGTKELVALLEGDVQKVQELA